MKNWDDMFITQYCDIFNDIHLISIAVIYLTIKYAYMNTFTYIEITNMIPLLPDALPKY